jgi:hypothetical protein
MMPTRWQATARQLDRQNTTFLSRIPSSLAAGRRTYRLRPANLHLCIQSGRVHELLPSRVFQFTHLTSLRQYAPLIKKHAYTILPPLSQQSTILQSAFPTKTAVFVLVIGGLAYYFVDIKLRDWTDDVLDSEETGVHANANPLHFYRDQEEIDHYLQNHAAGTTNSESKNPQVLQLLSETFGMMANGWETDVQEAREWGIPVTHGCRFKVNNPCVSVFPFRFLNSFILFLILLPSSILTLLFLFFLKEWQSLTTIRRVVFPLFPPLQLQNSMQLSTSQI